MRGQFEQKFWTGKQLNVSYSRLKMSVWRETRGSASPLPSGSAPVSWAELPGGLCAPMALGHAVLLPKAVQKASHGPVLYTSAEQSVRRCAPREGCQESAAMATTQHFSTTTAPADLVNQHCSFKNTLFSILCSSILLLTAFQRLEMFGY